MRLKWLDGIKGLACFAVLWHHFLLAFYPGQYNGSMQPGIIDYVNNPLSFIVNGNFMVTLFMVASGVVAGFIYLRKRDIKAVIGVLPKRYIRLVIPTILIAVLVVIFTNCGVFCNLPVSLMTNSAYLASWYTTKVSLLDALKSVLYSVWISTDTTISGIFWVFPYFLWGYILSVVLCVFAWKDTKGIIFFYVVAAIFTMYLNVYFGAFVCGVLIAYLFMQYGLADKKGIIKKIVAVILVVLGLYFGGYPSFVPATRYYGFLPDVSAFVSCNYAFWHVLGAVFLITGIWLSDFLQKIFELKFFTKLGEISYEVFLIHMLVLCTASCAVFSMIFTSTGKYNLAALLSFVITNVLVYILACAYHFLCGKLYFSKASKKKEKVDGK